MRKNVPAELTPPHVPITFPDLFLVAPLEFSIFVIFCDTARTLRLMLFARCGLYTNCKAMGRILQSSRGGRDHKSRISWLCITCFQGGVSGILETRPYLSSPSSKPPGGGKNSHQISSFLIGMEKSRFFGLQPHEDLPDADIWYEFCPYEAFFSTGGKENNSGPEAN